MVEKQELEARFKELTGTDRAGIMLVLIHGQKEEKLFGQIINRYLRKPVLFYGMDQLILKTDEICERIGTPMLSMAPRFLQREEKERYQELSQKKNELEKMAGDWHRMSDLLQAQAPAAREILEIQVLFRGNATMQESSGVRLPAEITSVFAVPWSFSGCSERWKSNFVPITSQTAKCPAWPDQVRS